MHCGGQSLDENLFLQALKTVCFPQMIQEDLPLRCPPESLILVFVQQASNYHKYFLDAASGGFR